MPALELIKLLVTISESMIYAVRGAKVHPVSPVRAVPAELMTRGIMTGCINLLWACPSMQSKKEERRKAKGERRKGEISSACLELNTLVIIK